MALGGLLFTDNPIGEPSQSVIGPLSFIGATDFRLFTADGDPQQGFDHLDFRLGAEQGLIALLRPDLLVVDFISYGPQRSDISQGRVPDGVNTIASFETPTPGAPNSPDIPCTVTVANLNLMTLTNLWKYNQTNNLDTVNWQAAADDDSNWPAGPGLLAFESNPAITALMHTPLADPRVAPPGLKPGHAYYFRGQLNLATELTVFTVTASAYIDDGAILYVSLVAFSRVWARRLSP